ncbi:YhdH, a putative quinone oxidoreductase [Thioalkalivibrio nitratireducens DSM 14787]|uniref:YhdH, a putative quinone oxidoreductase n=1 Tax=Thioalkalivibrio nitratireducens (strain DSM 14787 / UNIQEM 213 / ALEN2) TaxID=1255043 RepID=L0E1A0_THIND|nr:MDR family oxidoreductase [Thioalkalivibrio nitratireducens]AGA34980.1 YhdH, a putative quinone oxidoreductase [Thioalkalivibrio nitratireducens DSM 14787]
MTNGDFDALVLEEGPEGLVASVRRLRPADLPAGDVLVRVSHSGLNYKDAMILKGLGRLVRRYPHVAGVDLAGTVVESGDTRFRPGDAVLLTGWRVGETHWGGYAQMARVRADWLVPLPEDLTPRGAMAIGTAGFTAMLAVQALEDHGLAPGNGEVLVTGASGGLGGIAVALLARLGHTVAAVTGRPENAGYLEALGASRVVDRSEFAEPPAKPLLSERWAGCIDAVGGDPLAHLLAEMRYGSSVAACGLAAGTALRTTMLPFLLRGVKLLGIDSVMCPRDTRLATWNRLTSLLPSELLDAITTEIGLDGLVDHANRLLEGKVRGRVVVTL